jgi:hypothetical protein
MIEIPPNHKYATLALPVTHHLTRQFTDPLALGDDLWVSGDMPVALPEHWQTWLGSLRVDELKRANLFLLSHRLAAHSGVLDHENEELKKSVHRLYFALLIAAPYFGHDDGTMMTGAHHEGSLDVRNVQQYDDILPACGCHGAPLTDAVLQLAKQVFDGTHPSGGYWRAQSYVANRARVLRSASGTPARRALHQFVRCVEGFIFPDEGKTKKQMTSRSELFLGATQHALMQTLFDIRSAVEHLHGPARVVNDP